MLVSKGPCAATYLIFALLLGARRASEFVEPLSQGLKEGALRTGSGANVERLCLAFAMALPWPPKMGPFVSLPGPSPNPYALRVPLP